MHPALFQDEILENILSQTESLEDRAVNPPERPQEDIRTLFSSALVCRAFLQPALRRLWWRQQDLHGLFQLLPGFTYHTETWKYILDGCLSEGDWDRFDAYACLIKKIIRKNEDAEEIDDSFYTQVQASRKGRVLFPSLQCLYTHSGKGLFTFLTPTLRDVTIFGSQSSLAFYPLAHAFINALPALSPPLQRLELQALRVPDSVFSSIAQLKHLREITLCSGVDGDVNPNQLARISELPYLDSLFVYFYRSYLAQPLPQNAVLYPSLRRLQLLGSLEHLRDHVQLLKLPRLERACLVTSGVSGENDTVSALFYTMFRSIQSYASQSLVSLELEGLHSNNSDLKLQFLEPLFELRWLEVLVFSPYLLGKPTDVDLEWFGDAWPNLKELAIKSQHNTVEATFKGLAKLLKLCPRLQKLSVVVSTRGIEEYNDEISSWEPHGLRNIDVGCSLLVEEDIGDVIKVLGARLYTNLEVFSRSGSPLHWDAVWNEITAGSD